jgi:hypothetical protein
MMKYLVVTREGGRIRDITFGPESVLRAQPVMAGETATFLDAPPPEGMNCYKKGRFSYQDFRPPEEQRAIAEGVVRQERNRRLNESDWRLSPDAPVADKAAWVAYRQALRDVPKQAGFPFDVAWPEEPPDAT